MDEQTVVQVKETVTVRKFDHTHEDHPTEPYEVVVQETTSELSLADAQLLGFKTAAEIAATATVQVMDHLDVTVAHD